MYQVIILEKGKKPYVFETDSKTDANLYEQHMFDEFKKAGFRPTIKTTRDALGNVYSRVFQDKRINS